MLYIGFLAFRWHVSPRMSRHTHCVGDFKGAINGYVAWLGATRAAVFEAMRRFISDVSDFPPCVDLREWAQNGHGAGKLLWSCVLTLGEDHGRVLFCGCPCFLRGEEVLWISLSNNHQKGALNKASPIWMMPRLFRAGTLLTFNYPGWVCMGSFSKWWLSFF